jgi:hypothetical protein
MSDVYIIIAGATILISIWICYELIKSAVQKANEGVEDHLKTQNRLLIKLLEKQGATYDDLFKVYTDSDEDFWKGLTNPNSSRTKVVELNGHDAEPEERKGLKK